MFMCIVAVKCNDVVNTRAEPLITSDPDNGGRVVIQKSRSQFHCHMADCQSRLHCVC